MTEESTPEESTPEESSPVLSRDQLVALEHAAERLAQQFDGTFNLETVQRCIDESRDMLMPTARVTTWLPMLIERFTRDRLVALTRLEAGGSDKPAVLFLCVHNAGRSQMAAGWLRHLAGDAVEVFSGGSNPGAEVNAAAIAAMSEVGIDIATEYPKPWTEEIARSADVIVTMGCGDACPIFPGKRYEDWELADPAGQSVEFVREVRDDIRARVEALMASLELAPV